VSDDGAGIGVEKVRQKAMERGLITAERAALLGERELLQLIFLPGFSTAAAVTNVSGRGVGMDVVKTNVEKIGGKVEIESRPGKGTTLRMRIPLTLAIIPALIVRSVGQSFALPQGALSELVHVPPEQAAASIEWMEGAPLYRLRGKLLPLVFLDRLLMPEGHAQGADGERQLHRGSQRGRPPVRAGGGWAGRSGRDCGEAAQPVLKNIGLYSGATVLGNADLALILDPGSIALRAGVTMSSDDAKQAQLRSEKQKRELRQEPGVSAGGGCRAPGRGAAGRRAAD
jgi:two-component system chemotaxis sensor kinase CheA